MSAPTPTSRGELPPIPGRPDPPRSVDSWGKKSKRRGKSSMKRRGAKS